jgi:subtilase family serine protease
LAVFKGQYVITGCQLTVVNQHGGSSPPATVDPTWAMEESLDVEWACAMAPAAHILVVEARTNRLQDMLAGVDYAAKHANYVSNSWGTAEFAKELRQDRHYAQAGVSFFASAGDNGLGSQYPAASPHVISVGGTTLTFDQGIFQGESGWPGSGAGCSAYEVANLAQQGNTGSVDCSGKRATPDVSFDADPASGVSVYNSTVSGGQGGWFQIGGTSVGTPIWAALAADAGIVLDASTLYNMDSSHLRDITEGDNGASCLAGFDLVTGRGSPLGQLTS